MFSNPLSVVIAACDIPHPHQPHALRCGGLLTRESVQPDGVSIGLGLPVKNRHGCISEEAKAGREAGMKYGVL